MLRLGFFERLESDVDAILMTGDGESLQRLADALRTLEDPAAPPIEVHRLPFVSLHRPMRLTAFPVDVERGIERVPDDAGVPVFTWHHSKEGWLEAAELIEPVAGGGHQYLSAHTPQDALVIVSNLADSQYDAAWWRKK
jgi:hypothetical protein